MPVLPNPRHEAFAQALAKGKTADEAYAQAGYSPNRGNATRLKANENIRKRVSELQGRVAEQAAWSAAERMKSLQAIHDAQVDADPRTAIAAIAEANKMDGSHKPTKLQHSGAIGSYDLTRVSDADLDRLEAILGPLADTGGDPGGAEA
jgi:phage terminase small subunit